MKSLTTMLKLGLIVLVVAGLAISGLALAESGSAVAVPPLDDADGRAIAHLVELLTPLVDDGTITDAQAEAVAEHLTAAADRRPVSTGRARRLLAAVADLLGMAPDEVVLELDGGATLADIATARGSSGEVLVANLVRMLSDRIRVADGVLSEERAGELLAAAERRIEAYVFSSHQVPERAVDTARRRAQRRRVRADVRLAVLDVLGMSAEELRAELPGSSLAVIAESRGVSTEALVDGMVAPIADVLDRAVASGRLTPEASARRLAEAVARAEALIAGTGRD